MAEFQDVAKHWKRMCRHFHTPQTCQGCPIAEQERCFEACVEQDINIAQMEKAVILWAAEHPEPVYPTWYEYLSRMYGAAFGDLRVMGRQPIPADIAEKLGIEPKER